MRAVMYGAGNIGRGFVGALFAQSGYSVTFIDVMQPVVDSLNKHRCYPIRVIFGDKYEDINITGVDAVHGQDENAVANAIANADIMAISVGANVLPRIISNLTAGLRLRWEANRAPLNILLCENLMDVDKYMEKLIKDRLDPAEQMHFDKGAGLIKTTIGRMTPLQTPDMQDGNPMRICVERYDFLPVDKAAFKGDIPEIQKLVPFSPFEYYMQRKLYLHNMSHAICAYLGTYIGCTYIYEAIEDAHIRLIVKDAMLESMAALSKAYGIPMQELLLHADDLLIRYANRGLRDTCERVGRDPARKLALSDRLVGAALFCYENGAPPICIAVGAAAALFQYLNENGIMQNDESASAALCELASLDLKSEVASNANKNSLVELILGFYMLFRQGTNPKQLYQAILEIKKQNMPEIV